MTSPVTIFPDKTCWVRLIGEAGITLEQAAVDYSIGLAGDHVANVARYARIAAYDARVLVVDGSATFSEPTTLDPALLPVARFYAE